MLLKTLNFLLSLVITSLSFPGISFALPEPPPQQAEVLKVEPSGSTSAKYRSGKRWRVLKKGAVFPEGTTIITGPKDRVSLKIGPLITALIEPDTKAFLESLSLDLWNDKIIFDIAKGGFSYSAVEGPGHKATIVSKNKYVVSFLTTGKYDFSFRNQETDITAVEGRVEIMSNATGKNHAIKAGETAIFDQAKFRANKQAGPRVNPYLAALLLLPLIWFWRKIRRRDKLSPRQPLAPDADFGRRSRRGRHADL